MQPNPMALPRVVWLFASIALTLVSIALFPAVVAAQQARTPARITRPIDETNLTTLRGNTHPLARAEFDRGPAPSTLPLNRMLLVLQRSPDQEAALKTLLDQQQDKSSAGFHQWLTPDQFGQQFGPADEDIQTVTAWLASHGFQVNRAAKGRTTLEFSGTAGQLREAFHTEIHKYSVNGEDHWANASDPQIPSALAPVVAGIATLHNFYKRSQILITGEQFKLQQNPGSLPQFTSTTGQHALAPADYATIYNINPLYSAGINGSGTTIAVVGRSDFTLQDVVDFRNLFSLPSNTPQIVVNGPDPGILNQGEQFEATLDATWSGAIAPNAQVLFVVSASTTTTDGLDLSEQYIIDNNLANVMTESFSGCEAGATSAEATAISSLAEQAAAEGITYVVSAGDSGPEGCDNPNTETLATGPLSVNILASTPFTVGVGGTEFNEGANTSKYWSATNSTNRSSALSYIPEDAWNASCTSGCGQNGGGSIFAGGGGASTFFAKPSWQSAVTGIPSDGFRDLPDVSLTAAGHDPYLLCFQASCEQGSLYGVGGTSASAPSFAAIMALANQKTASRQGQANFVLYRLAAQETLSNCNASNTSTLPASTCIFNDVTVGNNAVPGEVGYGASGAKYQSTVGYDLATGLGSVNAANLVNGWSNARSVSSTTTLSLTPSTGVTHGTPLDVSIGVGATPPATGSPTGDVALIGDFGSSPSGQTEVVQLTLSGSTANSTSVNQLPGGTYNVKAHYEGDGTFVPSDSSAVQVNILPEPSTETGEALGGAPQNLTPITAQTYGMPLYFRATVAGKSGVGVPTGLVNFTDTAAGNLASATLDSTGTATTPYDQGFFETAGLRTVTATYVGDVSFQTVTSSFSFTLTPAATTTTIQPPSGPIVSGSGSQLTVNITASGEGVSPTGTITALLAGTQLGGPIAVSARGPASAVAGIPVAGLAPGQNTLTVNYSGDSNYQKSTSAPSTVNVVRATSTAVTASASMIQATQSVTLAATVASTQSGGPALTGSVQFSVSGTYGTLLGAPITVQSGQAQLTTTALPWGSDSVTAMYSGDSNYGPSSSNTSVQVSPITTTTVVVSSNPSIPQGQSVTFTATVTSPQPGAPPPTGGVNFGLAGSVYTIPLNSTGQALWTINGLPLGMVTITANYLGDSVHSPSSATITETITATPSFTISASPTGITVAGPGGSGSTTLMFSAQNGLTGSATLTSSNCSNLPSESMCTFSPSTVNFTSSTTTEPVMMTVNTQAPSALIPSARRFMLRPRLETAQLAILWTLAACVLFLSRRRLSRRNATFAFVALAIIASVAGCGGGGSSGGGGNPGTPTGAYTGVTVTVTINGVTQSIDNLTVNVQ